MTDSHPHKPPRRILHTSDAHMAFPADKACQAFEKVIGLAIKTRADLLLIAGDLFDHNRVSQELLQFVAGQFHRLPIAVALLPGNHDCLVPGSVYENAEIWRRCRNLHVFRQVNGETLELPHLQVAIWGRPIDTYWDVRPFEKAPRPQKNGAWNIALGHGLFAREAPQPPRSYIIKETEIKGVPWDYVALGHMPIFDCVCRDPVAYYSGSPESGTAALVDLDEDTGVKVTRCQV